MKNKQHCSNNKQVRKKKVKNTLKSMKIKTLHTKTYRNAAKAMLKGIT